LESRPESPVEDWATLAPSLSFEQFLLAFESIALSSHDDDFRVMDQTVDESGDGDQ
jgi:hypothetical protein